MKASRSPIAFLAAGGAIAVAVVFGTVAAQQSGEGPVRKAFAAADTNADGAMDVNEFVANTIYLFKEMDKDRDGYLSMQEWSIDKSGDAVNRFLLVDRNGDGRISIGEAVADKMIQFFEADSNRDGVITVDELLRYERGVRTASAGK